VVLAGKHEELELRPSIGSFSSGQPFVSFVLVQPTAVRRVAYIVHHQLPPIRFLWATETSKCFKEDWFRELLENAHRFPVDAFVQALLSKVHCCPFDTTLDTTLLCSPFTICLACIIAIVDFESWERNVTGSCNTRARDHILDD